MAGRNRKGGVAGRKRLPEVLKDLRAVYKQKDAAEATKPAQKMLWDIRLSNPSAFVDKLTKAETDYRRAASAAKAAESGVAVPSCPVGPQEEALDALLDRLLSEFEQQEASRSASASASAS